MKAEDLKKRLSGIEKAIQEKQGALADKLSKNEPFGDLPSELMALEAEQKALGAAIAPAEKSDQAEAKMRLTWANTDRKSKERLDELEAQAIKQLQSLAQTLAAINELKFTVWPRRMLPIGLDVAINRAINGMKENYPEKFGLPPKLTPEQQALRLAKADVANLKRLVAGCERLYSEHKKAQNYPLEYVENARSALESAEKRLAELEAAR